MLGEVVVVLDPGAGPGVDDVRKPSMQLASKMRFISARFDALLCSAPTCGCAARPTPTRWRAGSSRPSVASKGSRCGGLADRQGGRPLI